MASRTQLRLAQLTGSLDDTKAAAASISETSIQGVLDHLAASIKRIHGGSVFQNQTAGAFSQTINVTGAVTASAGLNVGTDVAVGTNLVIGNDLTLATDAGIIKFGDDEATTLTHSNGNGLLLGGAEAKLAFGQSDFAEAIYSSADGQVDIVAGTEVQIVAPTLDIDASSQVNISNDLVVGGNLTVNGSQTVLDTTSLVVEDSVIALASGSAANADVNSALVFQRATADLGGGTDMQNGALMFLQGTGFKLGYTNDNAETAQGSLAIANDDLATVWVDQLNLAGNTEYIHNDSGKIVARSGGDIELRATTDIIFDADGADIFLKDGGAEFGKLTYISAQNTTALSSSAGNDLGLDANTGNVMFSQAGAAGSSPATAAVNVATTNEIKFGHYDAPNTAFNVGFLTLKDNATSVLSASSGLQIDAGANPALLQLKSNNANGLSFKAPGSLAGSYTAIFPGSANLAVGKVLKINSNLGGGEWGLDWESETAATYTKGGAVLTAGVTAGANLDLSGLSNVKGTFASNLDTAAFGEVDLYVNGSLMLSGSAADVSGGNVDYRFNGSQTAVFTFDLEIDDTVQVFKRA